MFMPIIYQSGYGVHGSRNTRRLKIGWRPSFLPEDLALEKFATNADWSNTVRELPEARQGCPTILHAQVFMITGTSVQGCYGEASYLR
jgi:hypothetical protein